MSLFHPLEVVGRGSATQLQVGENLNKKLTGKGSTLQVPDPQVMTVYY